MALRLGDVLPKCTASMPVFWVQNSPTQRLFSPSYFQTERTQRFAHPPSFCELVVRADVHAEPWKILPAQTLRAGPKIKVLNRLPR